MEFELKGLLDGLLLFSSEAAAATHEAEEADAVDARAAAAEETHHGEDEAEDDQCDRKLIDDDDRLCPVVDEQRPQRQRLTPHVQPDTARYQRPSANLDRHTSARYRTTNYTSSISHRRNRLIYIG